jgi:Tfp pilus assembly protein FimT
MRRAQTIVVTAVVVALLMAAVVWAYDSYRRRQITNRLHELREKMQHARK